MAYYRIKAWYLGMSYSKEYLAASLDYGNGVILFTDAYNKNKKYRLSAHSADIIEYEYISENLPKENPNV